MLLLNNNNNNLQNNNLKKDKKITIKINKNENTINLFYRLFFI